MGVGTGERNYSQCYVEGGRPPLRLGLCKPPGPPKEAAAYRAEGVKHTVTGQGFVSVSPCLSSSTA